MADRPVDSFTLLDSQIHTAGPSGGNVCFVSSWKLNPPSAPLGYFSGFQDMPVSDPHFWIA